MQHLREIAYAHPFALKSYICVFMRPFKTIVTAALAVLVLLSSSSFMIGVHRCAGEVRHIGVFAPAQVCEMERQLPPCHRPLKKSCCENETIVHQGNDLKPALVDFQLVAPAAMDISHFQVIAEVVPSTSSARTNYVQYDPPLRWDDITIAHRVLLI
jgi:hypothetical protein